MVAAYLRNRSRINGMAAQVGDGGTRVAVFTHAGVESVEIIHF